MKCLGKELMRKLPFIVYSDSHILVAYKPPGMVVPIENHRSNSLEGFLLQHLKETLNKETIFLRPIHRLDKPVEGLVLFARSSKALTRLNQAQRERKIDKFYVAKVPGSFKKKNGLICHFLVHGDHRAEIVKEGGKEARLMFRVFEERSKHSVLSLKILTGRYHQIRIQLSATKHPIVGDARYGNQEFYRKDQIALCHTKLILPHPTLKKKMIFKFRPENL
ncbi:MAG: Ribosomal large subunit pseudouridine synthase C [Chlamydiae bacterium]|nr:Ribosomal large subunit pseudouridine synthase C [Chlamydiota bacterium]